MSTTQIQVLLVEDDDVNALAGRTMLERLGCRVDWVVTGAEAVYRFGQDAYDLILMDSQMPLMDGFEATARIRGMPLGWVTPIVGTSAGIGRPDCLAAGMNDVMPKPFLREKLKVVLSKWTHWDENLHAEVER